ncbi:unnamed protein product [Closterium sp. Naga37s-1]|nr:unnamed protein product [Closterium sp. Naga37s-1]
MNLRRRLAQLKVMQPPNLDMLQSQLSILVPTFPCPKEERVGVWADGRKWLCNMKTFLPDNPVVYRWAGNTPFEKDIFFKFPLTRPLTFDPFLDPSLASSMQALSFLRFLPIGLAGAGVIERARVDRPGVQFMTVGEVMGDGVGDGSGGGGRGEGGGGGEGREEEVLEEFSRVKPFGNPAIGQILIDLHHVNNPGITLPMVYHLESVGYLLFHVEPNAHVVNNPGITLPMVYHLESVGYLLYHVEPNAQHPDCCIELAFIHQSLLQPWGTSYGDYQSSHSRPANPSPVFSPPQLPPFYPLPSLLFFQPLPVPRLLTSSGGAKRFTRPPQALGTLTLVRALVQVGGLRALGTLTLVRHSCRWGGGEGRGEKGESGEVKGIDVSPRPMASPLDAASASCCFPLQALHLLTCATYLSPSNTTGLNLPAHPMAGPLDATSASDCSGCVHMGHRHSGRWHCPNYYEVTCVHSPTYQCMRVRVITVGAFTWATATLGVGFATTYYEVAAWRVSTDWGLHWSSHLWSSLPNPLFPSSLSGPSNPAQLGSWRGSQRGGYSPGHPGHPVASRRFSQQQHHQLLLPHPSSSTASLLPLFTHTPPFPPVAAWRGLNGVAAWRGLNGVGLALVIPAIQSLVADSASNSTRGMHVRLAAVCHQLWQHPRFTLGISLACYTFFGLAGWRMAFIIVTAVSLGLAAMLWLFAHPGSHHGQVNNALTSLTDDPGTQEERTVEPLLSEDHTLHLKQQQQQPHHHHQQQEEQQQQQQQQSQFDESTPTPTHLLPPPPLHILPTPTLPHSHPTHHSPLLPTPLSSPHSSTFLSDLGGLFGGWFGDEMVARRWPDGGRLPHFAEIVPERLRMDIYALDRTFEMSIAAFAPPLWATSPRLGFGYIPPSPEPADATALGGDSSSGVSSSSSCRPPQQEPREMAVDAKNAEALSLGLFWTMALPFAICCACYGWLYWTYPKDPDRVRAEAAAEAREDRRLGAGGEGSGEGRC